MRRRDYIDVSLSARNGSEKLSDDVSKFTFSHSIQFHSSNLPTKEFSNSPFHCDKRIRPFDNIDKQTRFSILKILDEKIRR